MKKMLLNSYHFTIIEDQAVPLAGTLPTDNYSGYVLVAVIIAALLLIGLVYNLWFREHRKRIKRLETQLEQYGDAEMPESNFTLMHPKKLLEAERLLEQNLAGYYVTEATNI